MLARKALAGTAGAPKLYVEDVMSCFLYTGNGSTQTITNNIDLSTEGGLVWIKSRNDTYDHFLYDTLRGATKSIQSSTTSAEQTYSDSLTAFNSTGFALGANVRVNANTTTYASWTFRKAKKFFDVVTFTTSSSTNTNQRISHNLGSTPGTIIVKNTGGTSAWPVWHRSLSSATDSYLTLNTTTAASTYTNCWGTSGPTSTDFGINTNFFGTSVNCVAYLFAHDAGGFGDAGSDSIIKCDSVVGSSQVEVSLGWEPQWILVKNTSAAQDWWVVDNMRGLPVQDTSSAYNASNLRPNLSDAETTGFSIAPSATGFKANVLTAGQTYIYIAIRRGPMKTPTSGTSVFAVTSFTGVDAAQTSNFPVDFVMNSENLTGTVGWYWVDRLRGATKKLESNASNAEGSVSSGVWDSNTTVKISGSGNNYKRSYPMFRRAPGFFDVVCYTGTGSNRTVSHSLGVVPELIIVKTRGPTVTNGDWAVYDAINGNTKTMYLNASSGSSTNSSMWNNTSPTSSVFTVGTDFAVNYSTDNYVAYLFASVSGVSKVGSYTGNGSSVTVTTDFQPRFILVKRTNSGGNWIVGDSARGLVDGNDPYLLLNSTAVEETGADWVDISSTGFTVNQTNGPNANVNTGTYIYLAIA